MHDENFLNFCFWLNNVNFTFSIYVFDCLLFSPFYLPLLSYFPDDLKSFIVLICVGFVPQTQAASTDTEIHHFIMSSSEVPASPANIAEGGKASLQPKRTPVSEREIEAVQVSSTFFPFMGFKMLGSELLEHKETSEARKL